MPEYYINNNDPNYFNEDLFNHNYCYNWEFNRFFSQINCNNSKVIENNSIDIDWAEYII
jgi:hypothetical protein